MVVSSTPLAVKSAFFCETYDEVAWLSAVDNLVQLQTKDDGLPSKAFCTSSDEDESLFKMAKFYLPDINIKDI